MTQSAERPSMAGKTPLDRVPFVTIVQAIALLFLARALPTWVDEEYTLRTTSLGVARAIREAIRFENQAPLYFAVLAAWRELDHSVFFARVFSVVCAVATVALAVPIAERVWPRGPTRWFAAALALHPFVVFAATEIRLYAAGVALSAALWLAWHDGFFAEGATHRRTAQVWFVVLAVAGCWVQYYLGFMIVAFGVALLLTKPHALRAYAVAVGVAALGIAPLAAIVRGQVDSYHIVLPFARGVKHALDPVVDFLLPHAWVSRDVAWSHALYYLGLVALVGLFGLGRPRRDALVDAAWITAAAIASAYVALVVVAHVVLIIPRHELTIVVPLLVAAYATLARFRATRAATIRGAIGAMFALASIASLVATYHDFAKSGDAAHVAAYLNAAAAPADAIAAFDAEETMPLRRYLDPRRSVIAIPRPLDFARFTFESFAIRSDDEVRAVIAPSAIGHRKLWLVVDGTCSPGNQQRDYGCAHLRRVVAESYRSLGVRSFRNATVSELAPR